MPSFLSESKVADFQRDGVLVLPDFKSKAECAALLQRAHELVDGFAPSDFPTVFSGTDQTHARDAYFLESGGEIRFFLETDALGPDGKLVRDKHGAVNKIGHALHDRDPLFSGFSRDARLAALAADLGVVQPLLLQSMLIFKSAHIGGEVSCHQDATYLYTEPSSVLGLWFALEDATLENGCMWALRGGHRGGLKSRFLRGSAGMQTQILDEVPWPAFPDGGDYIPLVAPAGSLVVLHGLLPHLSGPNRSSKSRAAYTLHLIDGVTHYPASNWLQRAANDPVRGF